MNNSLKLINQLLKYSNKEEKDEIRIKSGFTERQEEIFRLKYVKGKSIEDISDILGYSIGIIKNELKTIRMKIEKSL